jgi:alkylation response protein AidB-like acyl-CoA dehydrogenase
MDFNPSDLQRMMLDSAQRFVCDHYTLEHRRTLRTTADGLDVAGWQAFAELGWLSILVPEECGGLGGTLIDAAVLATTLGTRCITEPFVSSAVIGVCLLTLGAPVQQELLDAIVAGEARIALAHDEPGERYAYGAPRLTCLEPGSNGLVMSGQKMLVLDAPSATHLVVTAQGPDGLYLVLVPAAGAGVTREDYALHDGSRASDIRFDGVMISPDAVLARADAAASGLALALDHGRIILAAQAVGSMEAMLEICSAYLKERQQFGQPIGNFQALQHIMADMFVATHQARSALYLALSQMDADAPRRARAVALARITIAEGGQMVSRQAIQLHGGYGVTDEYEVSHHYRRQLVLEKQYGDLAHALQNAG